MGGKGLSSKNYKNGEFIFTENVLKMFNIEWKSIEWQLLSQQKGYKYQIK